MTSTKNYIGYWWLPENESNKVAGTLVLNDNGDFVLQILDFFKTEGRNQSLRATRRFPLIIGVARDENSKIDLTFKLLDSIVISNSINKLTYYKIQSSFFLTSQNPEFSSNLKFDKLIIEPQHLNRWLDLNSYSLSLIGSREQKALDFDLSYRQPEPITLFENEDYKLNAFSTVTYGYPFNNEFKSKESARLALIFKDDKDLKQLKDYSNRIRNFLTLAIGTPVRISNMSVSSSIEKNISFDYFWRDKFDIESKRGQKFLDSTHMLFGYPFIKENVKTIFTNWFSKYESLKFTINNFFGTLYNDFLYSEDKFLNYIFGLEVYHRTVYGGFDLKKESYLKIRQEILDKISGNQSHIEWLTSRLKKYKENTLKQRIEHLLTIHKESLKGLIDHNEIFINKIVETRHYHVHERVQNMDYVVKDLIELNKITSKLRIIIQAILMYELGFEQTEINIRLRNSINNKFIFESKNG